MFFFASKLVWAAVAPSNIAFGVAALGLILLFTRRARAGRAILALGIAGIGILGYGPVGQILLRGLESRFAVLAFDMAPPAGIIVLGGSVNQAMSAQRGQVAQIDGAERQTEALRLAQAYPAARLIFTGGSAALFGSPYTEGQYARRFWEELGMPASRIEIEERSRNTDENARFVKALANPKAGERWLLVTSAYHMPRAVGVFRQAGFPVIPYPVDFRTYGDRRDFRLNSQISTGLSIVDFAAHEWAGLAAYALSGKSESFLPSP